MTPGGIALRLAAAIAGAGAALILLQWRRYRAAQAAALWPGNGAPGPSWPQLAPLVAAAGLLAGAAAWPASAGSPTDAGRPAADDAAVVVFAIDVSRSMAADDQRPTRLQAGLSTVQQVIDALDAPAAVAAFAGESMGLAPLTADRGAIALALQETARVAPQLRGGSSPAVAIDAALDLLSDAGRPGAIVVVSDGEWTDEGGLAAALDRAAAAQVRVHALAVGTDSGATMTASRAPDATGAPAGETRVTRLNREALAELSSRTNGSSLGPGDDAAASRLTALLQSRPRLPGIPGELFRRVVWLAAFLLLVSSVPGARKPATTAAAITTTRPGASSGITGGDRSRPFNAAAISTTRAVMLLALLPCLGSCARGDTDLTAGNRSFDQGAYRDALSRYDAASGGRFADRASFNSGLAHERLSDRPAALAAFSRAAARAQTSEVQAQAHFNRGNLLAAGGQLVAAERAFIDALRANPDMDVARVNLAIVRERLRTSVEPPPEQAAGQPPPRYAFPQRDPPRQPPVASDW